jgi:hypothetical protein
LGGTGTAGSTLAEYLTVKGNGNVGIGTTSPTQTLDVNGSVRQRGANTYLDWAERRIIMNYDNTYRQGIKFSTGTREMTLFSTTGDSGGSIIFKTRAGSGSSDTDYGTERMRITGGGNVGIGTSSPGYKLHVSGDINFTGTLYQNGTAFSGGGGGGSSVWSTSGSNIYYNTGNVGIGTTSPNENLEIYGTGMRIHDPSSSPKLDFVRGGTSRSPNTSTFGQSNYSDWRITADGPSLYFQNQYTGGNSGNLLTAMTLAHNSGNVGIGTTSPLAKLDIGSGGLCIHQGGGSINWYNGAVNMNANGYKGLMFTVNGDNLNGGGSSKYWMIGRVPYNTNLHFSGGGRYSCYMRSNTTNTSLNFTGQHRTFIKDVPFTEASGFEGLIVSASQNKYIKMNGGIEAGSNAITTNESLPVVTISNTSRDKKCFGVISASEDPETREDDYGNLVSVVMKESGDTRVYINSVGEGAIWVTNINGNLESGDYITTSNVTGYGMKQDSEFLVNYTVAKITMDCDFEPVTQPVQQIVKELTSVNYWVETTYSNVALEEYSNLAEENRRTVTDNETVTYQAIGRTESTIEQEGWTHEVREELTNVLDEHGQLQWEDHPTETEKAYKIRYLTSDGQITDEANAVHIAAFVGCTYHCG